ncbi:electron transport complex protein RnfA [Helcococcus bovis]|uniref:electron transport complex protein RnfA n=1 Tax=Helcococcus bovis TaxID=3153252 RepID=UPI0038BCEB3A
MTYISIIIAAVLVNNMVLTQIFGVNPAVASSKDLESTITMGLSITFVTVISSIVSKIFYDYVLLKFNLEYLKILSFVIIVVLVIEIFYSLVAVTSKKEYEDIKSYLPSVTANSMILGVALIVVSNNYNILSTIAYAFGVSLGFVLVTLLLNAINEKYKYANLPRHFLEKPITLFALGLMALAFYGFKGLI